MKSVTFLDTAVASTNLGDQIIMEAAESQIRSVIGDAFVHNTSTHEPMFTRGHKLIRESDYTFVGGSNLLKSRMWLLPQWKIHLFDALFVNDLILFGCGWHQYQGNVDLYTRLLYRSILSNDWFHSVRDGYTKAKLEAIGITNVLNTGCPSLWNMSPEHCASIPREKAEDVVCTLTIYNPKQSLDLELIKTLRRHYRKVYFWVQTLGDYEYSKGLDPELEYIEPSLAGLDGLLHSSESIDYVGTRLHAGIRALQAKRRAIIVEIDNRATEMGKDYGLVTVARDDFEKLNGLVTSTFDTTITLEYESINKWKSQFLDPA